MGREQGMFSTAEEKQIVFFTNTKKTTVYKARTTTHTEQL